MYNRLISPLKLNLVFLFCFFSLFSMGQYGPEIILSSNADNVLGVTTGDLDGDGDLDIVSASSNDDKIAWYRNLGNGSFSGEIVLSTSVNVAGSVATGILTSSGLVDVVAAGQGDFVYFKNLGNGNFSQKINLSHPSVGGARVEVGDIDNDGFEDIVFGFPRSLEWFRSQGNGNFDFPRLIFANSVSESLDFIQDVEIAYIDNDSLLDVAVASFSDDKLSWYKNLGNNTFGGQQIISSSIDGAISIEIVDLDQDGNPDVLGSSSRDDEIVWFLNSGNASFGAENQLTAGLDFPPDVYGADIEGDGDIDILFASQLNDKIGYFENAGLGVFTGPTILTSSVTGPRVILGADLNNDMRDDVICGALGNDRVTCFLSSFCDIPTNLKVTNLSPFSVLLEWDSVTSASSYTIRGSAGSFDTNTSVTITTTNPFYKVNGLQPGNQYIWQVSTDCGGSGSDFSNLDTFITLTIDFTICPAPQNLISTVNTSTSASLSWDAVFQATNYVIRGSIDSFDKKNLVFVTSSSNLLNVNSLQPSRNYFWQVQSVCDKSSSPVSPFSNVVSFNTSSLKSNDPGDKLLVYPNPSHGILNVKCSEGGSLKITDYTGKTVYEVYNSGAILLTLELAAGYYFVQLSGSNGTGIEKIVVSH